MARFLSGMFRAMRGEIAGCEPVKMPSPETPAARLARQRQEAVAARKAREAEAAQRLAERALMGQEEIKAQAATGNWWNPATGDVGGSIGRDYFGAPRRRMRSWRGDPVQAFIDRIREYTR